MWKTWAILVTIGLAQESLRAPAPVPTDVLRALHTLGALRQLGQEGAGAAPTLRRLSDHSDPQLASAAQRLLDRLAEPPRTVVPSRAAPPAQEPVPPEPPRLDDLLARLAATEGDPRGAYERTDIYEELGRVGLDRPDVCVPILTKGLEDRRRPATAAAAALVPFGPECGEIVVQWYREQLDDGWALYDYAWSYGILARIGTPEAFEILLECEVGRNKGQSSDQRPRLAFTEALGRFGAAREPAVRSGAIAGLAGVVRGETWSHPSAWTVERVAAEALVDLAPTSRRARDEVERALFDGHEDPDRHLLSGLYRLGPAAATFEGALLAIIEERAGDRRGHVVLALGVLGSIGPAAEACREPVLALIGEGDRGAAALWAASRIAPSDRRVVELLLDSRDQDLECLRRLLRSHPPSEVVDPLPRFEIGPEAVPALLEGLREYSWEIREVWLDGGYLGPPVVSLEASAWPLRYVKRLRRIPEATQELLPLLADPDPFVRTQAALALGGMDPPHSAALEPLLALLGQPVVGTEAASALASYGRRVVPALVEVLEALPR